MLTRSHFSVLVVLAAMMSIAVAAAAAQTTTFERKVVTSDAARRIVDACVADAADWTAPIAVAVVDPFGILIDFHAMQGASETSGTTALLKAKTAARWRRTTATVNQMVTSGANQAPLWIGSFPQPGAVPIVIDGLVVGAVGVGGVGPNPYGYGEPCARAAIESVFGPGTTPPPLAQ